jgi:hypothetical protein
VEENIHEFDEHYHEMLPYLPDVHPSILEDKYVDVMEFTDIKPDGTLFKQSLSEYEGCELFLVRCRDQILIPHANWTMTDKNLEMFNCARSLRMSFPPALPHCIP